MRVPRPKPRIDVEAATSAVAEGKTIAEFARCGGYSAGGARRALRRAGVRVGVRPSKVRDSFDHRLNVMLKSIRDRCESPRSKQYRLYGAKGVRLCKEWHDFATFRDWARANGYRPGRYLALTDVRKGYRPSNCTWTNRSTAIQRGMLASGGKGWGIHAFGETKTATAWAKDPRCPVSGETIRTRIRSGVAAELAITLVPNALERKTGRAAAPLASGRRSPRKPIDWSKARKLYVERELGVPETAKQLGVSYHGVLRGLQKRGWLRERPIPVHKLANGAALYRVWQSMRERCLSPQHPEYARIGAEGIGIDTAWEEFRDFHAWALRSGYRKGLVFTRLDRTKDYGPETCVWLPRTKAGQYHRPPKVTRTPRWTITAFGETKGPVAWTRDPRATVSLTGLVARLKAGMPPEEAISSPNLRDDVEFEGNAVEAFGMTKSIAAWARDRRARVGPSTISQRLARGVSPEAAISMPPYRLRP